jgi:hypothetical protein
VKQRRDTRGGDREKDLEDETKERGRPKPKGRVRERWWPFIVFASLHCYITFYISFEHKF